MPPPAGSGGARCSRAEEERRLVFDLIAQIMQAEARGLFQDFARHDDGSWAPEHREV